MEQFIVRGVDKLTGREVERRIDAVDAAEAQAVANDNGIAVGSVEPLKAPSPVDPNTEAALADRLQRLEDAIEVNSKLARAIALDSAELRRVLTERKSTFFDALYSTVRWAVAIGVLLAGFILLVVGVGLSAVFAAAARGM